MRDVRPSVLAFVSVALTVVCAAGAAGQPAPAGSVSSQAGAVRQLSSDEAVRLALENNLGLKADRLGPQIQELGIAQARSFWTPAFTTRFLANSADTPSTNVFSGGAIKVNDSRVATEVGVTQVLPTGGNYTLLWSNSRATSTNIFSNFDPLLDASLRFDFNQPLLRNFKIDSVREQLAFAQNDRTTSDLQLRTSITRTTRLVRNAYWDLVYQIDSRAATVESLELARRQQADNERRVQVGTMAAIDVVEAQAEVARNEESVIIAESAIREAEDRLRALIFAGVSADLWTVSLEPTDKAPFVPLTLDVDGAIQRAMRERLDLQISRNGVARNEIGIQYLHNQTLPDISAQASYLSAGAGGSRLAPIEGFPVVDPGPRPVINERGTASILGDVFTNAFPTWSVGVSVSYPIGTSTAEADLARARLQQNQAQAELKRLELQAAIEVRTIARQVETNQKRVQTTRVSRELAERRLEAAQKKLAAGIETTFFVFQAQRDLTQARTNEVKAAADYNKSLVDFEAVQTISIPSVLVPATAGP